MDTVDDAKILVLSNRFKGNEVASYDNIQSFLLPQLDNIAMFWWTLWICILAAVFIKFVVAPNWPAARRDR